MRCSSVSGRLGDGLPFLRKTRTGDAREAGSH